MTKTEFLQILREELDGRVPYSVIQENLNYYNSYIDGETAKGRPELQVIEELGGPRIIARTIVDATLDTEDRPDGFQSYGGREEYDGAAKRTAQKQYTEYRDGEKRSVHYVDFSKWYVRLLAGLAGFVVIFDHAGYGHSGPGRMDSVRGMAGAAGSAGDLVYERAEKVEMENVQGGDPGARPEALPVF